MFGLKKEGDTYIFRVVHSGEQLKLNLYRGEKRVRELFFDPEERIGDVWTLRTTEDLRGLSYDYEAEGHIFSDPNGLVFEGRRHFGRLKDGVKLLKTPVEQAVPPVRPSWQKDRPLGIPYEDSILYRLHVRGFTEDRSSGLDEKVRGTFSGIIEKLPYLRDLGVNGIELMPLYEFNEVMLPFYGTDGPVRDIIRPTGKINYWGFTEDALHLAPKASFSSPGGNPKEEFRGLVEECHRAGIEVIVDLYFTERTLPDYISAVMRYYRTAFHIDGIHLIGNIPGDMIVRDPYLSRFKIWTDHWGNDGSRKNRVLAEYHDGFQNDMRRILKGDESMVATLQERIRGEAEGRTAIQYMANETGFTLWDSLCYDRKHNEDNQERNLDGTDYNFSWNCGEEGPSRKKSVRLLRNKMFRNAMVLLLLSQGTPLINAGDEFGRTKKGNNNSYCQDNRMNWLDWRLLEKNRSLYEFTKRLIHFRKSHPVFHQGAALRGLDYQNKGIPDISFHGVDAWRVDRENFRRQLGVLYNGRYAEDDTFLVLYNFHWEGHLFHVPHPLMGTEWRIVMDTSREEENGFLPAGEEPKLSEGGCPVPPRSIVVLRAFPTEQPKKARRKSRKAAEDAGALEKVKA